MPLSWKKPRYVFVSSMSDVFHPRVTFDYVLEMFSVMREASEKRGHIFQALTKRPGRLQLGGANMKRSSRKAVRLTSGYALRLKAKSTPQG